MATAYLTALFLPIRNSLHLPQNPRRYSASVRRIMSWTCSKCTYLNPSSQKSSCQICLSPSPPSPSSSSPPTPHTWSCKACTFANKVGTSNCSICGTRASASLISDFEELDSLCSNDDLDSSIGSVFYPLQSFTKNNQTSKKDSSDGFRDLGKSGFSKSLRKEETLQACKSKKRAPDDLSELGVFRSSKSVKKEEALIEDITTSDAGLSTMKIMTYNVWFREDLEMHKRMKAIGDLIQQHTPDVICFQEVTPNIYEIFQNSSWWKAYRCSLSTESSKVRPYFCMLMSKAPVKSFGRKPFSNSIMGRELCSTEIEVEGSKTLVVATSHLESPCPAPPKWDQMFSKERVEQAKEALISLNKSPNVIFAGDMNWDDKLDGRFPLPDGWVDAWAQLRPREDGYTYDTKANMMLSGNRKLQKRLDRFHCNLQDYKIIGIDMIGMNAIPGLTYCKEKKVKNEMQKLMLPVLPSDHYGLLLTICRK